MIKTRLKDDEEEDIIFEQLEIRAPTEAKGQCQGRKVRATRGGMGQPGTRGFFLGVSFFGRGWGIAQGGLLISW